MSEHIPLSDVPSPHDPAAGAGQRSSVSSQLVQFVRQMPEAAAVFIGPHHDVEVVNSVMKELWGQSDVTEAPNTLPGALPKVKEREFEAVLDEVYRTGKPIKEQEVLVKYFRNGKAYNGYYNFVFDALRNEEGGISGTMVVATEVTELVKARQENERRQQQVDDLLEQAPVAVSIYRGPNYVIEMTNTTACQLTGRSREESLNKPLFELLPEFANLGLEDLLDQVMTTGEPYVAKEFPTSIDRYGRHETAYWDFIYYPYRNAQQDIIGVTVMGNEVTSQVEARQQAEREQHRLLNIFEQFPVGVGIYRGPKHTIELVNSMAGKLWGVDEEKLQHQPLLEVLPELREQGLADMLDEVYRTGEPFMAHERPVTFNRKDKSGVSYFDFLYYAWLDEHDQIIGVISVAVDVSERVAARQEEYQLRALLNHSTGFVGLANTEGQGVFLNPAGRLLVGIDVEEPISEYNILDFFMKEDRPFFQETILPALLDKEKGWWGGEYNFRNVQTDETIPVLYNCFAVRDPTSNELLGLGTITVDITERRKRDTELRHYQERLNQTNQKLAITNEELSSANEELYTSNEELINTNGLLTRANTDLDNFVYTASHDLKAPITNIQGLITLLRKILPSDSQSLPRMQRTLEMMESSVNRFMRTITDLSDITRLQRQEDEPKEPVNLSELIEEVRMDVEGDIEQSNAQLDIDVEACGSIPFPPKNLRSIVYNLLSNAIKYRDPQRDPHISIRCQTVGEHKVLTVTDNGLGMNLSDDVQPFGLFRRLHSHVDGTGIGLYIVKKIIENAGGKIEVTSEVGVGTTFIVYFRPQ